MGNKPYKSNKSKKQNKRNTQQTAKSSKNKSIRESVSWITLKPVGFQKFGSPLVIDNNNFILVSAYPTTRYAGQPKDKSHGIYKYNVLKNKWHKITNLPHDVKFYQNRRNRLANVLNENKTMLYVMCKNFLGSGLTNKSTSTQTTVFELNLKKCKWNPIKTTNDVPRTHKSLMINDNIHLFHVGHSIWNKDTKTFETSFPWRDRDRKTEFDYLYFDRTPIFIKSQQIIMLFGGTKQKLRFQQAGCGYATNYDWGCVDDIWIYSSLDKKWKKLNITLPERLSNFGMILCKNERFILIFGGITHNFDDLNSNRIYIFDVEKRSFSKSKVTIPFVGRLDALLMSKIKLSSSLIVTYGFIRNLCKNTLNVPNDIIHLISSMVDFAEFVHLFQDDTGKHIRINVDHLFQ